MFRLTRPRTDEIDIQVRSAYLSAIIHAEYLAPASGLRKALPVSFAHDRLRSQIARDVAGFKLAIQAFEGWKHFDLGWVRVANPLARIAPAQIVAIEVHSLGLWSLNLSRIVEVIQTADSFGFIYKTTEHHVEEGEERFFLTLDEKTGAVWYETEAVSRPRSPLAQIGYPVTRAFQHRFARDSHRRMRHEVAGQR